MMRAFALIAPLVLAACQPPLVSGGPDSGVRKLAVGMTYDQVRSILGPQSAATITPDPSAQVCVSWVYDETFAPKYIHARFADRVLQTARDGFDEPCTIP